MASERPSGPFSWILRPIVWFATASVITTTFHEMTHAGVAYLLGVRGTLFNYSVDLDLTTAQEASFVPVLIWIAGPVFSLVSGLLCLAAFRRVPRLSTGLPLLFLAAFGIGTFVGNVMAMSSAGDLANVAVTLHLPMAARYTGTALGLTSLAAIQFWLGRQLVRWVPAHVGRPLGILGVVVLPVIVGTAALVLIHQPTPPGFAIGRATEASFSLFAVIGAAMTRPRQSHQENLTLRWADVALFALGILAVRTTLPGLTFVP